MRGFKILVALTAVAALSAAATAGPVPVPGDAVFGRAADLDGDGDQDVVIVRPEDDQFLPGFVQVLINDGNDGGGNWLGFTTNAPIQVGAEPRSVAIGLFNADAHPDLAVPATFSNEVRILHGDGAGGFTLGSTLGTTFSQPLAVATADMDDDGILDLVVSNNVPGRVDTLIGDGLGGFTEVDNYFTQSFPDTIVLVDFDDDGALDVATVNSGGDSVTVAYNEGDGTYSGVVHVPVGDNPLDIDAADYDLDGSPDVTTSNINHDTVSVLLNNGSGSVLPWGTLAAVAQPIAVASGDFDTDGDADLVASVASFQFSGQPGVILYENLAVSDGGAGFGAPGLVLLGPTVLDLIVTDVNDDGVDDIVTANAGGGVSTVLGSAEGACCLPGPTCVEDQTLLECETVGGVWQGTATACAGVTCPFVDLHLEKTADVSEVCDGTPTPVTFTITLTNPGGFPMENVTVLDFECDPVIFVGGDTGNDGVLTPGETWTYTCTYDVSGAVDNIAQVIADVVNIPSPSYVEQALYSISALPAPPCDVTGPISACVSQSLMYTGPAGASSYAWQISGDAVIAGPADQQTVTVNVLVGTGFTLTLDTTGTNGCGASCMLAVTIGPTPGCTYFGPSALCVGVTKTYTMTGPGAPSIAWSVDPPSVAVIVGPDDQTTVDVMGVGTGVFDLSVQVISAEGCENVCSADFDVIPLPTCAITPPDPAPACGSTGNQLSAIVFDAPGVIGYTWSVDPESGWSITGGGSTDTVTYSAVSGSATFTLDIVSGGCPSSCQLVVGCAEVAACCLPDETCVEVDAASCADAAGFFRSDGVGCDEAGCPPPGLVTDVQKISETASGFEGMLDADDGFGAAVAEIGDLDNDGVPDLAVGAPGDDDGAIDAGAVWILLMNADGTVKTEQKISATTGGFGGALAAGDGFGSSVAGLGDVNGDGMEDIVVGAPFSNRFFGLNDEGAVYVLFMNEAGTVAGFLEIANLTGGFGGFLDSGANLGSAVESAGDVDGNGVVDLAIGARNGGTGGDGAVWIVLLSPAPEVIGETRITEGESGFVGPLDDPNFGSSVTRLGDMDNNGTEDLLVGAPKDDSNTGELWVLFMTPAGTVLGEQRIAPGVGGLGSGEITSMDLFGAAVASIRDLNGDGVTDVAVGAPGTDGGANVGAVWILFLESDGTVGVQFEIADNVGGFTGGLQPGDAFGSALASVGDLDSDGLRELAVGAPGDDDALGPVTNQGAVWFLQLAGVPQVVLGPPTEFPAFGAGIIHESAVLDTVGVGPGDGGGTNDVVVVIPNADPELNGVVQLFIQTIVVGSGFAGFNEPAPTYTVGRDPTDVALGDYNGDEFTDVAVTNAGDSTVMIFLNDGNGFGTITLHDTVGGVNVPTSIVAGDFIGGDGFPDLAVTNFGNDTVVILSNDGSANFAPADQQAAAIPVGGGPIQMDPIDIDNDKNEDIVTGNFTADSTSVLQNNGNGTFSRQDVSVGDDPFDIAVADFDADGRLDLATANNADGTVTVSRNVTPPLGAPAFDPVLVFNVAVGPVSLDAGDLNDDGFPDLVVIADDQVGGTTVYALTNASQFSSMIAFTLPEAFDALADPNFVATADFDGDGVVDVVTVNNDEGPSGGSVTVFLSVPPVACPADLSGNDAVDFADILSIIAAWGPCSPGDCPQDLDGSGDVGFGDILQVIGSWGSCSGP